MKIIKNFLCLIFLIFSAVITLGAGYTGTLPDVQAEFAYMRKSEKAQAPFKTEELDKKNAANLKTIPLNNDTYIDIMIKRDKPSKYIKDINAVIAILEKLRICINTDRNIQMFNAAASNLIDNAEYIRTKYKNTPESNTAGYKKLISLSTSTRKIAAFWTNGLAVMKYKPYTSPDNIYTKENLNRKLEDYLLEVNETIFILRNGQ